jgi:hypothetical protein
MRVELRTPTSRHPRAAAAAAAASYGVARRAAAVQRDR